MSITCKGPIYIIGYNKSVLCNIIIPDSTLNNKSQLIAYHIIREDEVRYEWRTIYVHKNYTEADLLM